MRKLNREELVVGLVHVLCFAPFLGKWAPVAFLVSFLWALGGAQGYSLGWRRFGATLVLCLGLSLNLHSFLPMISYPFLVVVTSTGYGIPDEDDEGSPLGRWAYGIVADEEVATTLCRGVLGLLFGCGLFILALFNVWWYLLGVVTLTLAYPILVRLVE